MLAEAEADTGGVRSEIASRRRVVDRFPDFWWGVFRYADWLLHFGSLVGHDPAESKRWLERTLELNPRLLPGWEHFLWVAAADGDTVQVARALAALQRLNAGPDLREGWGFDIMPFYRLILEAWRQKGRPAASQLDTVAKELATPSPLVQAHYSSGDMLQYGWPAVEIELDRRLPAFEPDSERLIWSRRSLAHAWAARGAWDSALTAAVENAHAAGTAADSRVALRLAITGAWVGAVPWDEVKRIREGISALTRRASAGERTDIAWLDGVAAVGREDRAALNQAVIAVRDPADPNADRLAASLELLGRIKEGGRAVADSLASFAEDRADRPRGSNDYHPLLGALLNLEAGRLLLQHGDTTRATRLLLWPANVENLPHAQRLSWMLAGLVHVERGRVAEAQGQREQALHHYREFLRRYDMPVAAHRHLVTEAEEAVRRLEGRKE
jgi:tetratricopeptide (TPR) repeat protein